jgi:glycosyltransferase involved in cell wall biosynthesis
MQPLQPKISVILPFYNAEKYVFHAIKSVLCQSFENFELLLINDGSNDNSIEIIKSFNDQRIRIIENDQNIGLIKTLNKGVLLARGEYIARMDADDICRMDRFQKQYDFLEKNQDYVMCGTWATSIDCNGNKIGKIKRIDSSELIKVNMLFTTPFIHPSVMIRSKVLQIELYNLEALHCEDMELWPRLAQHFAYKFANIKEFLLEYRIHDTNISVVNKDFQNEMRKKFLSPYTEKLIGRVMSEEEKQIHFLSYHLKSEKLSNNLLIKSKDWFVFLSESNKKTNYFIQNELDALFFSRWIVLCFKQRSVFRIFNIPLVWYKPSIFLKVFKLLWFK